MRDLMDGDPQPKIARPEREAFLQREHIATDVVDRVGGSVVVEDEEVVLAEDALCEVAEEDAGLGTGHPPPDRRDPTTRHPFTDARGEWSEEPAHRRDVRRHP